MREQGWGQMRHFIVTQLTRSALSRADDKTAAEYNLEAGQTLHLVLALRGGCSLGGT